MVHPRATLTPIQMGSAAIARARPAFTTGLRARATEPVGAALVSTRRRSLTIRARTGRLVRSRPTRWLCRDQRSTPCCVDKAVSAARFRSRYPSAASVCAPATWRAGPRGREEARGLVLQVAAIPSWAKRWLRAAIVIAVTTAFLLRLTMRLEWRSSGLFPISPKTQPSNLFRPVREFYWRNGVRVERIMTDQHRAFRTSKAFHAALAELGIRHILTRPYRPQTNGKAERFFQTLLADWAYVRLFRNNSDRLRAYPAGSILQSKPTLLRAREPAALGHFVNKSVGTTAS
jgi:transposase InsO family protein